jgi:hypothetical protein
MLRQLLTVVLPLMLPTLIYMGYMMIDRRKAASSGNAPVPWWVGAPWVWLVTGGVFLAAILLFTLALTGGSERSGVYHPAHLIDGHVVEGETTPAPQHPAPRP